MHDFAERKRVAQLVGGQRPLLAEGLDVADEEPLRRRSVQRQRQVVLAERVVRELTDHRSGPHADQQREQALHEERADVAGVGRQRVVGAVGVTGGPLQRTRKRVEHRRDLVERRPSPLLPVDALAADAERGRDARRVRDARLRGPDDVVEARRATLGSISGSALG